MTQQTKLGLIAFGAVLGMVVLVGIGLAVVLSGDSSKEANASNTKKTNEQAKNKDESRKANTEAKEKNNQEKKTKDLTGPISTGSKDDPVGYICGHRWWSKSPSKKQLDAIVDHAISMKSGGAMYVDGDATYQDSIHGASLQKQFGEPETRRFYIYGDWPSRPTREQVLTFIKVKLDAREYDQGPGR